MGKFVINENKNGFQLSDVIEAKCYSKAKLAGKTPTKPYAEVEWTFDFVGKHKHDPKADYCAALTVRWGQLVGEKWNKTKNVLEKKLAKVVEKSEKAFDQALEKALKEGWSEEKIETLINKKLKTQHRSELEAQVNQDLICETIVAITDEAYDFTENKMKNGEYKNFAKKKSWNFKKESVACSVVYSAGVISLLAASGATGGGALAVGALVAGSVKMLKHGYKTMRSGMRAAESEFKSFEREFGKLMDRFKEACSAADDVSENIDVVGLNLALCEMELGKIQKELDKAKGEDFGKLEKTKKELLAFKAKNTKPAEFNEMKDLKKDLLTILPKLKEIDGLITTKSKSYTQRFGKAGAFFEEVQDLIGKIVDVS